MNWYMYEEMDPYIREVIEEFDSFCRNNDIAYLVESDEHNEQVYRVPEDWQRVEKHMKNYISDKRINMNMIENKHGNLFSFTVKQLQEDQYKFPGRKLIRTQSAYPSSLKKSKTFGGRGNDEETNEDSVVDEDFERKLDESVLGLVEPDILFVVQQRINGMEACANSNEDNIKSELSHKIKEMLDIISHAGDEDPSMNAIRRSIEDLADKIQSDPYDVEGYKSISNEIDRIVDQEL